ncbi:MAG: PilZ domain-containing protein [Phycisphaerales bacterium]|nr:PilZ domain-containing protein [Phycisphaerales bacterium]
MSANKSGENESSPPTVQISKALLDRLDDFALRQLKGDGSPARRVHPRYRYRHVDVRLILSHSGGRQTFYPVCMRNISAGGLAFLDNKALMPETNCRFMLPAVDKKLYPVDGLARSCRLVEGSIYEVGVEFIEPVDLSLFVGADSAARIRTG